jgi:hypothetical protein
MKDPRTIKFQIPKWSLYALLSLFIFSAGVPSSSIQQKETTRTEQRDVARSVKSHFSVFNFNKPVSEFIFYRESEFLTSLFFYSTSIQTKLKNRTDQVSMLASIGVILIANFLPRSTEAFLFQIRGSSYPGL